MTQKTAWFMDHRIRHALSAGSISKMSSQIEGDETYIGGHHGHWCKDKVAVLGIHERCGKIVTKVIDNTEKKPYSVNCERMFLLAPQSLPIS